MSLLDILKKFKFPSFGDDFIQDPAEKAMDAAPGFYGGKMVYNPCKELPKWMDDEWERHGDPSDGASMSNLDVWEE